MAPQPRPLRVSTQGARVYPSYPQHQGSHPVLTPLDTSIPNTSISQHRRPSAPTPLMQPPGTAHSPVVASPLNNFTGSMLASSPISSRPGSATTPAMRTPSGSRPTSSRGLHISPSVEQHASHGSLAGAVIDLTNIDAEGSATKRRKFEHVHQGVVPSPRSASAMYLPQIPPTNASASVPPSPAQLSASSSTHQSPSGTHASAFTASQPPQSLNYHQGPTQTDTVMEEQQTTIEEDCLEANFDEDEQDEKKLWCRMCRLV